MTNEAVTLNQASPDRPVDLDPERLLRREFFYHLPSVALVLVVGWPLGHPVGLLLWAFVVLGLVKIEHWWASAEQGGGRLREAISFTLTLAISCGYALAAGALVSRSPSAALFACVLLTSSMVSVLLRYFHRPLQFVAGVVPQALILAVIGFNLVANHLRAGNSMQAVGPAATFALFVLLFWAARDQLAKMHKALAAATSAALERERAANAANQAKSAFLATVSHEIRTPLNGVLGMAQAMDHDALAAVQRDRIRIIRQCGESLLAIVNDVLDLSKIEAGKLELEQAPFDLEDATQGAAATFQGLAQAKGLDFTFEIEPAARGRYLGDVTRVRQVLHNLVSNAVKFTLAGSVLVRIGREGELLTVSVTDTGIGIAPENLAKLFDKFVQADASTTRRFGGSGLGLSIAHELVQAMGGGLSVESQPGQGSTFTATLALPRLDMAHVRAPLPTPEVSGGLRILAAEDNPVNQQVLKAVLGQLGLEPVIAGDGRQAVEAWGQGSFDLILMDIQMPEMDGVAAARAIRAKEAASGAARTPILALTANAMTHQAAEYRAAGMDGLVAKPIDIAKLVEGIEAALSGQGWPDVRAAS